MSNFVYHHQTPPGIESRLIQLLMGLVGMKRAMEKKVAKNTYRKKPADIPKSIFKKCHVEIEEYNDRKVWTITPKTHAGQSVILFLHGGAYYANISHLHWKFVEQLQTATNATILVPDYPLAPQSSGKDTYRFLDAVYAKLIHHKPDKQIVFMGDSSGGGLALGFAMHIKNEGIQQPEQIILISPWLDVSMSNPAILKLDASDKILSIEGLKMAGKKYAGDWDVTDYRVSPVYGDFFGLGKISVFIGTHEVFLADALRLKRLMEEKGAGFNYFEYPQMFHDWVIVSNLKEAKDAINRIANCLAERTGVV